jgi:hypothetical protein
MQTFALPATVVASALGAVVLCLVLLLFGIKSEPDDEHSPVRRLLLIRLGHALAVACFAVALMLSAVTLLEQRRAATAAPNAASSDDVRYLEARVAQLEQQLAATEQRLSQAATVATAPPPVESRPAARPAHLRRVSSGRGVAAVRTRPASDDFGSRAREDWESVKRGFSEAGRDIQTGFADLGRRVKHAFD